MHEFEAIVDMLEAYQWKRDPEFRKGIKPGNAYFFMDDTDECFIEVQRDGSWAIYEYDVLQVYGSGVESLGTTLNEP
jgi:hypothetical protein